MMEKYPPSPTSLALMEEWPDSLALDLLASIGREPFYWIEFLPTKLSLLSVISFPLFDDLFTHPFWDAVFLLGDVACFSALRQQFSPCPPQNF